MTDADLQRLERHFRRLAEEPEPSWDGCHEELRPKSLRAVSLMVDAWREGVRLGQDGLVLVTEVRRLRSRPPVTLTCSGCGERITA